MYNTFYGSWRYGSVNKMFAFVDPQHSCRKPACWSASLVESVHSKPCEDSVSKIIIKKKWWMGHLRYTWNTHAYCVLHTFTYKTNKTICGSSLAREQCWNPKDFRFVVIGCPSLLVLSLLGLHSGLQLLPYPEPQPQWIKPGLKQPDSSWNSAPLYT